MRFCSDPVAFTWGRLCEPQLARVDRQGTCCIHLVSYAAEHSHLPRCSTLLLSAPRLVAVVLIPLLGNVCYYTILSLHFAVTC